MPRCQRIPAYRLHKPSGQARVILDGKHFYLGTFGTAESRQAYARLIAERFSPRAEPNDDRSASSPRFPDLTINELLVHYLQFAQRYYVKEGAPTKELTCMKEVMGPLRLLYGDIAAAQFGPLKLKAVRQHLIDRGLCRGVVNQRINRIKRIMKWAVSEELVPPAVYEGIRTVAGLRFGRSDARETTPVGPVPDAFVDPVLPLVAPQVRAMIELQRLTGMRPGEVILLRPCDIDMTAEVWLYEPLTHKNRWRGHRRVVPLGPAAQATIRPFLARRIDAFLFSPAEAEAWRNEQRATSRDPNRKTRIYQCELRCRLKRKQAAKRRVQQRPKGESYTVDSYRRAITYGIEKFNRRQKRLSPEAQGIPRWHPNQLRHSFATRVRKQFGVEAAQVGLGHARTDVVEVYAEKNLGLAVHVAKMTG